MRRHGSRRRGVSREWSNTRAVVVISVPLAAFALWVVVSVVQHDRFLQERGSWTTTPWAASWPIFEISSRNTRVPVETARSLYAFTGAHPDVMDHIPCYCGCAAQGHRSDGDCYVK